MFIRGKDAIIGFLKHYKQSSESVKEAEPVVLLSKTRHWFGGSMVGRYTWPYSSVTGSVSEVKALELGQ